MSSLSKSTGGLLKVNKDDSPLKTVIVYGGAAFGAYYLFKLLNWDITRTQAQQQQEKEVQTAATQPTSAAALAAKLYRALSNWGNTDETVVYDTLWTVASREFLQEIYASYKLQFSRSLEQDLYETLDPWYLPHKPDWSVVKQRLDYIKCVQRKVVNGQTTYLKICNPMPLNPSKP